MTDIVAHDPGGKVHLKLADGVIGNAEFYGDNDEYRLWLSRFWGDPSGSYALWIGMNPSTARADVDDPTVRREVNYTRNRFGYGGYIKCNVMDYRATKPRALLGHEIRPRSPLNRPTILKFAKDAEKIIVCYGALHKKLARHAEVIVDALRHEGYDLWCLGLTNEGHPRHPLYMRNDTPLQRF